ncbi:MAG: 4'-phosphopantetheinyl transferase superfamily protein [Frankiales bacterium]|nr:4'-phosphopantetheinyl transferase superfamily protein [Frankiales bacterium]
MGSTRVGVDLARASDVRESIAAFGDRYLRRVYTEHELAACTGAGQVAERGLAARFAAKEALLKALHVADAAIDWRDVEVRRTAGGWPELALHGGARRLAEDVGLLDASVSMTHDDDVAMAVVVAVCDPGVRRPDEPR